MHHVDTASCGDGCRQNLCRDLHQREASLTPHELYFLEGLCEHGDERDVQHAMERLRDENLFFDPLTHPVSLASSSNLRSQPSTKRRKQAFFSRSKQGHCNHNIFHNRDPRTSSTSPIPLAHHHSTPNLRSFVRTERTEGEYPVMTTLDDIFAYDQQKREGRVIIIDETLTTNRDSYDPPTIPSQLVIEKNKSQNESYHFTRDDDEESWKMDYEDNLDYYNPWMALEDDYNNGYGGGGTLSFSILGTSVYDLDAHPHVMSPALMESLQVFLPETISFSNFWMKYSMQRDGASMITFLQHARSSKHCFLAIETIDGEVLGAFTTERWHQSTQFFGGYSDAFLWRMRRSRQEKWRSIVQQAHQESLIDVFPCVMPTNTTAMSNGGDDRIDGSLTQLCSHDRMVVGGATCDLSLGRGITSVNGSLIKDHEWGFGLAIDGDFMTGTTSPCLAFGSPSLSSAHSDGSKFEIRNMELWTLTPCSSVRDATQLEMMHMFIQDQNPSRQIPLS